ncbi:MAG: WD40 repeat domain-containing protein [Acidiferrobacteraceae bacterium]
MTRSSSRSLTLLLLLMLLPWSTASAATLGTTLKSWLRLGKYRETVATLVATLPEPHGGVWGLAFSPDGRLLAASSPQTGSIPLWDWRRHRVVRRFRKVGSDIMSTTSVAISPNGRWLAYCSQGWSKEHGAAVLVWHLRTGAVAARLFGPHGASDCAAIAFTPDGRSLLRVAERLFLTDRDTLTVYSTRTWRLRWGLKTQPFRPDALALSPGGHRTALGGAVYGYTYAYAHPAAQVHQQILLVDLVHHTVIRAFPGFPQSPPRVLGGTLVPVANNSIRVLAWRPNGTHLVIGQWGVDPGDTPAIRRYGIKTGHVTGLEPAPLGTWVTALRYTPDGRYLIEAGIRHQVELWDGAHRHLLQVIPHQAWSLAVSPNGHELALGEGGQIQVWHLK